MAPPAWAYFVDNFTPFPDSEFICSICQNVFCDPLVTPCNHVFCKKCINDWLVKSKNCPYCRQFAIECTLKEVIPMLKNLISNLNLHCHNSGRGCTEILTIERCENHVKICPYESIQCSNHPCSNFYMRKDLHDHETKTCPYIRLVNCDACQLEIPLRVSGRHNCIMALKKVIEGKDSYIRHLMEIIRSDKKTIETFRKAQQKERPEHTRKRVPDILSFTDEHGLLEKALIDTPVGHPVPARKDIPKTKDNTIPNQQKQVQGINIVKDKIPNKKSATTENAQTRVQKINIARSENANKKSDTIESPQKTVQKINIEERRRFFETASRNQTDTLERSTERNPISALTSPSSTRENGAILKKNPSFIKDLQNKLTKERSVRVEDSDSESSDDYYELFSDSSFD